MSAAVLACAVAVVVLLGAPDASAQGMPVPPWISYNVTFREVSLEQGLITGSPEWKAGGLDAFSGATGGHPAYGWKHDHLLSPNWARAVVANYAARPAYYVGAVSRDSGYFFGSRPTGWLPDSEVNSVLAGPSEGAQLVDGVPVSGPDLEHFALSPLFSLAGSTGLTVQLTGLPAGLPAELAAATMLHRLMSAQAGMLRTDSGDITEFVCSDRSARYVVGNLAAAEKLGCIDPADAVTLNLYVRERLVPRWLEVPTNDPNKGGDLQVYNGVAWVVPALYDLVLQTPPGKYRQELYAALKFQCLKLWLLAALVPGKACQVEKVDSWTTLTPAGITTLDYLGPWEVRGMLVAGHVLNSAICTQEGIAEAAHWLTDASVKAWMVGIDGSYL